MAYYPRKRGFRKGRARNARRGNRKRVVPQKLSKSMTSAISKLIHKNVESKQAYHVRATASYNSAINTTGDCTRVVPTIPQGTNDAQRIGDQLRAQSLIVKGAIVYNPSTGQYGTYANARIAVRMMIVQPKQYSNIDDVQSYAGAWTALLLKKGSGTSAFNGNLEDLWAPINTDMVTKYYDRVIYLDAPYQQTAVGSTLMGRSTKLFTISLKLRNKVLKYDNSVSSGGSPTNYAPVLVMGYAHLDGSAPDTLTTALQLTYDTIFNYEDA